ncbi:acetyltransferase (GNAT) family, putative [Phytophthora infestans T30-4]|uniref:Acetyltransferase (GNAT) family, putative n=2 Tax=Phytophthora infestans TaxID=4787 RepID=D0P425_PHYIT|nr:acetyltransferase (GNAT) family, putative [Phytophthora infestans T30-4]EEY62754.1 acetyltransferase (GNAT) family, putative [Phytophthora infestans T30-4]KAF4142671.1 Acetyltransferase (GNAT) family [Phytophthora infestans]|eukprot:XP_002894948.1 acetyltransferase (GNAT) family, putative [Phytophthora infestans T30-4]
MTAGTQATIEIRQYRPEDHAQATNSYVEGMLALDPNPEYHYLWGELLRKDLTNDLADIEGSHMAPGGNFFVAVVTKDGSSKVVGIIGLLRESEDVGQIRRVDVDSNYQRMSIGRKMIAELESWAKQNKIKRVFLSTGANSDGPKAFYTSLGYTKLDEILYNWTNPQYLRLVKFVKRL